MQTVIAVTCETATLKGLRTSRNQKLGDQAKEIGGKLVSFFDAE